MDDSNTSVTTTENRYVRMKESRANSILGQNTTAAYTTVMNSIPRKMCLIFLTVINFIFIVVQYIIPQSKYTHYMLLDSVAAWCRFLPYNRKSLQEFVSALQQWHARANNIHAETYIRSIHGRQRVPNIGGISLFPSFPPVAPFPFPFTFLPFLPFLPLPSPPTPFPAGSLP